MKYNPSFIHIYHVTSLIQLSQVICTNSMFHRRHYYERNVLHFGFNTSGSSKRDLKVLIYLMK
jgi:hypothetical protein